MDDIAVYFEKIYLGEGMYFFKPMNLIRGSYDKDDDLFVTNYGVVCESISGEDEEMNDFFGYPTTLDDLKNRFGNSIIEEELLHEYLYMFKQKYYFGYYDYDENRFITIEVPLTQIEQIYNSTKDSEEFVNEEVNEVKELVKDGITLNLQSLENLRSLDNLNQIHGYLDQFIRILKHYQEETSVEDKEVSKHFVLKKEESKKFNLKEMRKEVLESIIGQDEAVCDITRALAINYTSIDPKNKSHILVTGPSGTGKTEIINIIANRLGLPVFKADATAYTKSGYQGKEVNSMLEGLIRSANGNIEIAQKGLLIIDEIDKKSSNSKDDVSGKAVLHSLLKIMDRDVVEVDVGHSNKVLFDTSNITVILMGSFDELYLEKQKYQKNPIGFSSKNEENEPSKIRFDEEDLVKWLGAEFEGRIGVIASTEELCVEDAVKILYKSKISQLKIIEKDLKNRGIKFTYSKGYISEIAKKGLSKKTGVRRLNKVVKDNLKYAYDDILTNDSVKELKLTKHTALDPKKYYIG